MTAVTMLTSRSRARVLGDAVAAELSKLLSLPAIWLTLAGTLTASVLLGVVFGSQARGSNIDSLDVGMAALPYAQAGLFVLGVIAACSEYIGGQIRTTLTAIPRRVLQRLAATIALILVAFPAALITIISTVSATTAMIGDTAGLPCLDVIVRVGLSAAIYLTCMVMFSSAIGVLIKRALPAAAILVLYLVIVSPFLLGQDFSYYLPDIAGYTLWFSTPPDNAPAPGIAWLIIIGWTIAAVVSSVLVAARRDV